MIKKLKVVSMPSIRKTGGCDHKVIRSQLLVCYFAVACFLMASCSSDPLVREKKELATAIYKVNGRKIFKSPWLAKGYTPKPIVVDSQQGTSNVEGFFCGIVFPREFSPITVQSKHITGSFPGFSVHVFPHELSSFGLNSVSDKMLTVYSKISGVHSSNILLNVYGASLNKIESETDTDRRRRLLYLYAAKCMLLPQEATNGVVVVESPSAYAFVFGNVKKGRAVSDVFLKDTKELITVILDADDQQLVMEEVYAFLAGLQGVVKRLGSQKSGGDGVSPGHCCPK